MTLTILLYVSLFGIIGLFSLKAWENKQGKVYAAALRERSDAAIEAAILRCVREYRRHDKERLRILAQQGFSFLRGWFLLGKDKTVELWGKLMKMVQGKREINLERNYNTPVSFFLKQISDYKNGRGHLESEKKKNEEAPPV